MIKNNLKLLGVGMKQELSQLNNANRIYLNTCNEINNNNLFYTALRYVCPERKNKLIEKLETQKNIVKKIKSKVFDTTLSLGDKNQRIEDWQDENDERILISLKENSSMMEVYPNYINDAKKIEKAYQIASSQNTLSIEQGVCLRKALRKLNNKKDKLTYQLKSNKENIKFCLGETNSLDGFSRGLNNFYYTAKILDDGLAKIVEHTDKIVYLFNGLDTELKVISHFTQEGLILYDSAMNYASKLSSICSSIAAGTNPKITNQEKTPQIPFGNEEAINQGKTLAQKIILKGGENGN